MRNRTITTAVVTATVLAGVVAVGGTASATTTRAAVANTKPAWTAHTKALGHPAGSRSLSATVYLAPRGGVAAVSKYATAAATPGSSSYHQWLTPAQYEARFGATNKTVSTLTTYLRSQGLKVTSTGAHNRSVTVRGSVTKVEKAFGTTLANYHHAGQTVRAPSTTVSLPSSLASKVLTVGGLDTTSVSFKPQHSKPAAAPPAGFRNGRPCSTYFGQLKAKYQADYKTKLPKFDGKYLSYAPCGYTGPQFRAAYEGATKLDGAGATVGIIDAYAAPTIASDSETYADNHGDGSYAAGQLTQNDSATFNQGKACGGQSGWYGEETLDVEAVHAMAPGADIRYYGGKNCGNGLTVALQKVMDEDKVQVVSNSYGDQGEGVSSGYVARFDAIVLQGATEGISSTFSSGDDGDELAATAIKSADFPASDPNVTAVGGTSTGIDGNGAINLEAGWGTDKYSLATDGESWTPVGYLYGAGGGSSTLFNQPSYQASVTSGAYRQVPDVAMDADPNTGMLIGETQSFSNGKYYDEYRIGGTSLASPLFAGMTALAVQSAGGKGGGLLNPTIYAKSSADFTDVTASPKGSGDVRVDFANGENASGGLLYSVRTFGDDSSLAVTKGYDQVTGVGVPNTKWLTALGNAQQLSPSTTGGPRPRRTPVAGGGRRRPRSRALGTVGPCMPPATYGTCRRSGWAS